MNDILPLLSHVPAAAIPLVVVVIAYIKINHDRGISKLERDDKQKAIEERVSILETRVGSLEELKQEVKEMNRTLAELVGMFKAKFNE